MIRSCMAGIMMMIYQKGGFSFIEDLKLIGNLILS